MSVNELHHDTSVLMAAMDQPKGTPCFIHSSHGHVSFVYRNERGQWVSSTSSLTNQRR